MCGYSEKKFLITPNKTGNCHPERSEGSQVKTVIGNEMRNPFFMSI